jgi:cytochrome c biogenesis protein CcdA
LSLLHQPLLIGAWIGLVHAFDADHLSTLSSLSMRGRSRSPLGYALRWSCGHAVAIGTLGMLALGLGILWVSSLSRVSEVLVAALLIALGVNTMVSAGRRLSRARAPRAAGALQLPGTHAPARQRLGSHAGLLMGLLHGGAGSAAVLAILPLSGFDSGVAALTFLTAFSVGVAAGALLFALLFSRVLAHTFRGGERAAALIAVTVGTIAVVVGAIMLAGTVNGG